MSDKLYAIKDTTLTALGDAVRSKVIGQSESEETFENLIFTNSAQYQNVNINISAPKYRYIITGYIEGTGDIYGFVIAENETSTGSSLYGGTFDDLTEEQFPIVLETTYKKLRFRALTNSSEIILHLDVVAIGLDENGNEFKYTPLEMAEKVNELMIIPDEALNITGNCDYRFAYGGLDWLIEQAGDKITTDGITEMGNMFYKSQVAEIPFGINVNISSITSFNNLFGGMDNLEKAPYVIGGEKTPPTSAYSGAIQINSLFNANYRLKEVPNDFFWKLISNKEYWDVNRSLNTKSFDYLFYNCYSLRELPDISMLGGAWTSQYSTIYSYTINGATSLNKAENYPVCGKFSSNAMSYLAPSCFRLKDFTFMVNEDGTPKIAEWKNQTLDFSSAVGWVPNSYSRNYILNYNSGITADKEVIDDATYQALKDDPDWFSVNINYSRYNHDSAVNTINSLPDCSATGTNIIKFKGEAGALTDGGAINTLTEEEIAVATAKGWTVSLV